MAPQLSHLIRSATPRSRGLSVRARTVRLPRAVLSLDIDQVDKMSTHLRWTRRPLSLLFQRFSFQHFSFF
jgi:hypothetical protein